VRLVWLLALVACGGGAATIPPSPREHPQRAMQVWATGDCVPRKRETDPCVELTAADVTAIRAAILAYLHDARDLPDAGLVERLVEPPIAQWTVSTYHFESTIAPGQGDALELTVSERVDATTTAGFTCVLARTADGWLAVTLSPFAAM
jgi:hypothetical protein